ncbi:unnamed protein product [Dibothriocephalus latus]|uniref:Uncharacterized protein n=1 Tax=Dibothriocephalus latus TaxID=60516 RepID=A0A3P7P529_DIBLA|nr:unnamed protein product [Dibothriocephalus latus]
MPCFCSALLLVPIILIGLVAVVTVTVGGFMHAEVCPYVGNTSGLRMTDYVVNSKIDVVWNDLIVSQLSGGGAAGNNFADILNLKAPQNLLYAVEVGCNPQNVGPTSKSGLLPKMGIDNLVNISALLESPILTEGIEKAEQGLVDGIVNAKLGDKIPDAILADVQNFTSIFQKLVALLNISVSAAH